MIIGMITVASVSPFSTPTSWSTVSAILIAIGLVATLLSNYRYLLFYLFGGMAYWLVVEGIQFVIVSVFPNVFANNIWQSYVLALSLTWLIPSIFLAYRYITQPANHTSSIVTEVQKQTASDSHVSDSYKEHTPIYNNYKPRFHN